MSSGNSPSPSEGSARLDLESPIPGTVALCAFVVAVHVIGGLHGWWREFESLWDALIWTRPDRLRTGMGGQCASMLGQGDTWQLWTSVLVHTDGLHLLTNVVALYALGRLLEPLLSGRRVWSWFWIGGVLGSYASWQLGVPHSDGASGGAFALLGAAVVVGASLRKELVPEDARLVGPILWFFVALNLVLSVVLPFVDAVAHVAGLLVGVGLGLLFGRRQWWPLRWLEWTTLLVSAFYLSVGWFWADLFRWWYWRPWLASQSWWID